MVYLYQKFLPNPLGTPEGRRKMKQKQLLSLILSLTLLFGLSAPAFAAEEPPFPDVEGHWAQNVIERWHRFGVIGGDTVTGAFRPDDCLTRSEFAALLNRIMGYPMTELRRFTDVPADAWYAEIMSRLNGAGIIQGDGNDMIRPKDPVTRQEAAVILCRALWIEEEQASTHFLDEDEIADWAAGSVGALYNRGAVQGFEGYFDPQDPITRAQAVTLLSNLIAAVMTKPGTWGYQDIRGDLFVNAKQARLENMTITGNLIITDGVANGDVTLSNVSVKGDIILRGCGERSFHILSGCELGGNVILTKSTAGTLRLVNESTQAIPSIHVNSGQSAVVLEGNATSILVNCPIPVTLRKAKVDTLTLTAAKADLTVEKGSTVSQLTIDSAAKDSGLAIEGTVTSLTANAAARVNNTGKINTALAAANGLVLAGNKPDKVAALSGVSNPKDGNGKPIPGVTQYVPPKKK